MTRERRKALNEHSGEEETSGGEEAEREVSEGRGSLGEGSFQVGLLLLLIFTRFQLVPTLIDSRKGGGIKGRKTHV